MVNPVYEKSAGSGTVTGRIIPIYRVCNGLNQRTMLQAVRQGLDSCLDRIRTCSLQDVRERCRLAQTAYAYEKHPLPKDFDALELARRRLIFEELFVPLCALGRIRGERVREEGIAVRP